MTSKEKAKEYSESKIDAATRLMLRNTAEYNCYKLGRYDGYLAGAKENGVIWHDLRKDPNDLPPKLNKYINCSGCLYIQYDSKYGSTDFAFYNFVENKWQRYEDAEDIKDNIIAWCEKPQFKE